jgi:SAM-dependent methyltransferase
LSQPQNNRFQDFFSDDRYVLLKNYLYNYRLRKRSIEKAFDEEKPELILEVGSGISPVMTKSDRIVYSDLSHLAIQSLRRNNKRGWYVVADVEYLPFRPNTFTHTVCSEVLEHVPDDQKALEELVRIMKPTGLLLLTFPHRKFYFSIDDRYVHHFRRYEISEILNRLKRAGLTPLSLTKILGPLEKVTMVTLFFILSFIHPEGKERTHGKKLRWDLYPYMAFIFKWLNMIYAGLAWIDCQIMPRNLSTVLLIKAEKSTQQR